MILTFFPPRKISVYLLRKIPFAYIVQKQCQNSPGEISLGITKDGKKSPKKGDSFIAKSVSFCAMCPAHNFVDWLTLRDCLTQRDLKLEKGVPRVGDHYLVGCDGNGKFVLGGRLQVHIFRLHWVGGRE